MSVRRTAFAPGQWTSIELGCFDAPRPRRTLGSSADTWLPRRSAASCEVHRPLTICAPPRVCLMMSADRRGRIEIGAANAPPAVHLCSCADPAGACFVREGQHPPIAIQRESLPIGVADNEILQTIS